jgi:hypothetical protein
VRNPARERSINLNREVWESPSVYGGEDVNGSFMIDCYQLFKTKFSINQQNLEKNPPFLPETKRGENIR